MRYFIVEHETRGTLVELDPEKRAGARFSLTGLRSDPELAQRFGTPDAAIAVRDSLPPRVAAQCKVLGSPVPGIVEWQPIDP